MFCRCCGTERLVRSYFCDLKKCCATNCLCGSRAHEHSASPDWPANEDSITELSKLGARVHMFDAKSRLLEGKLAEAHADLRERLFVFDRSFHALPKVEALLGLSREHVPNGFCVPPVFTMEHWREQMSKSAETLEAERKTREERERKGREEALARYNSGNLGPGRPTATIPAHRESSSAPKRGTWRTLNDILL